MSKLTFMTPVGRIVQGSMFTPSTTDINGDPLKYKSGPNVGQPRVEYYFGLAISKQDPGLGALMQIFGQSAAAGWPGGENARPDFSWKIIDGDSLDSKKVPYSARVGHAGCVVLKFSGSFAPKCFASSGNNTWVEVSPETIKTGDYIRVAGSTEGNGNRANPGIYLNYDQVEHVGIGEAIITGPSAADTFGKAAPAALPPGASRVTPTAAPLTGTAPAYVLPGAAVQAAPQYQQPGTAAPQYQQPGTAAATHTINPAFSMPPV